ncbi:MAG: hypothetical protein ABI779_17210 [Acidobacteriota bacterium]
MRIFVTVIAACAALYALALTWRQNERAAGLDFYIYFVASRTIDACRRTFMTD